MLTGQYRRDEQWSAAVQQGLLAHQIGRELRVHDLEDEIETKIESARAVEPQDFLGNLARGATKPPVAAYDSPHFRSAALQTFCDYSAAIVEHEDLRAGDAVQRHSASNLGSIGDEL